VLGCRGLDTDTIYIVLHFVRNGPTVIPDKKGRSGHKRGEISWTPTAFAGIHLHSYRLWWRLGVPFWVGPDKQLVEPSRPGAPVPATVDLATIPSSPMTRACGRNRGWRRPSVMRKKRLWPRRRLQVGPRPQPAPRWD
jgi:hypothetical protein